MDGDNFRIFVYRVPDRLIDQARSRTITATELAEICWSGEERAQRLITSSILLRKFVPPPFTAMPSAIGASGEPSSSSSPPESESNGPAAAVAASRPVPLICKSIGGRKFPLSGHRSVRLTRASSSRVQEPVLDEVTGAEVRMRSASPGETIVIVNNAPASPGSESDSGISPNSHCTDETSAAPTSASATTTSATHTSKKMSPVSVPSVRKGSSGSSKIVPDAAVSAETTTCTSKSGKISAKQTKQTESSTSNLIPAPLSPDPVQQSVEQKQNKEGGNKIAGDKDEDDGAAKENETQGKSMRLRNRQTGDKELNKPADAAAATANTTKGKAAAAAADSDDDDDCDDGEVDFDADTEGSDSFYSCDSDDSDSVRNKKSKKRKRKKSSSKSEDQATAPAASPDMSDKDNGDKGKKTRKRKSGPMFQEDDSDGGLSDDAPHSPAVAPAPTVSRKKNSEPDLPVINSEKEYELRMPSDDSDEIPDISDVLNNKVDNKAAKSEKKPSSSSKVKDEPKEEKPSVNSNMTADGDAVYDIDSDADTEVDEGDKKKKKTKRKAFSSSDESDDDEDGSEMSFLSDADPGDDDDADDDSSRKTKKKRKRSENTSDKDQQKRVRTQGSGDAPGSRRRSSSDPKPGTSSKSVKDSKSKNGTAAKDKDNGSGKGTDTISSDSDSDGGSVRKKKRPGRSHSSGEEYDPGKNSDSDAPKNKKKVKDESDDASDSKEKKPKKKRRRIRMAEDDSDDPEPPVVNVSDDEEQAADSDDDSGPSKRKKKPTPKKRVITMLDFEKETQAANKAEKERRARLSERQKLYNKSEEVLETGYEGSSQQDKVRRVILDYDMETNEPLVEVKEVLAKQLKPHQVKGVKFMYEASIESLDMLKKTPGNGCILAHSMGLGKTLQVITFVHTLLTNRHTKSHMKRVLVVCPKNTSRNWAMEFSYWLFDNHLTDFRVYDIDNAKTPYERQMLLRKWHEKGGVMIIGNSLFPIITLAALAVVKPDSVPTKRGRKPAKPKKNKNTEYAKAIYETLLSPGADLVVVDEGHLIKNDKSNLNKSLSEVATRRRIILTGTPLQNNLYEYHCMIQFVKPNLLGTRKEFWKRFVADIQAGQSADSTEGEIKTMKRKVHVLHKLLEGSVQRCDYNVLVPYLQPKHEFVLKLRLSEVQEKLYQYYLDNYSRGRKGAGTTSSNRGYLFNDCCILRLICCHPQLLRAAFEREQVRKAQKEEDDFVVDGDGTPTPNSSECDDDSNHAEGDEENAGPSNPAPKTRMTRSRKKANNNDGTGGPDSPINLIGPEAWFESMLPADAEKNIAIGVKIALLFEIMAKCETIGDKLIVFSQSLDTLDLIESLLEEIDKKNAGSNLFKSMNKAATGTDDQQEPLRNTWRKDSDYFRIDGGTASVKRKQIIKKFNDKDNPRARLILISTKAGSLGINLVGANRCIIFDASWNPTHDVQAIYRIYRFGQEKPCYVYRFVGYGTMEEKIYDRQIIKQALSCRVVDEQQIDRHFNANELELLYAFQPEPAEAVTPAVPKDLLLADVMLKCKNMIIDYHLHDSLLENRPEENLSAQEREEAWYAFENEKELEEQRIREAAEKRADDLRAHAAFMQQQQQAAQEQAQNSGTSAAGLLSHLANLIPGFGNLFPESPRIQQKQANGHPSGNPQNPPPSPSPSAAAASNQQQSPQPQPPKRGRPPGSVNHDPEKVITYQLSNIAELVKQTTPNAQLNDQIDEIGLFLKRQHDQQLARHNYLLAKSTDFPDALQRINVVLSNIDHVRELMKQQAEMRTQFDLRMATERRKEMIRKQMEQLAKDRQKLVAHVDDPD